MRLYWSTRIFEVLLWTGTLTSFGLAFVPDNEALSTASCSLTVAAALAILLHSCLMLEVQPVTITSLLADVLSLMAFFFSGVALAVGAVQFSGLSSLGVIAALILRRL